MAIIILDYKRFQNPYLTFQTIKSKSTYKNDQELNEVENTLKKILTDNQRKKNQTQLRVFAVLIQFSTENKKKHRPIGIL